MSCSPGVPLSLLPPTISHLGLVSVRMGILDQIPLEEQQLPDTGAVDGPWASRALLPGTVIPGDSGISQMCFLGLLPQGSLCFSIVNEAKRKGSSWLQRRQEKTEFWGNETHSPREGKLGERDPHSAVLAKPCVPESKENLGIGCLDESEQGERDLKNQK